MPAVQTATGLILHQIRDVDTRANPPTLVCKVVT